MKITRGFMTISMAAMFAAPSTFATPLTLTTGDKIQLGYGTVAGVGTAAGDPWGGGEFDATGISVANGSSGSFITFCLEYNEEFNLNGQYYVRVNYGAVNGGVSTAGTYLGDTNGTTNYDPISKATAWLYTQFRNNTLTGFTQGDQADADSLQLAIWKLEGELSPTVSGSALNAYNATTGTYAAVGLQARTWVADAIAGSASWTDVGNVRALNLYDTYNKTTGVFSGNHQDQLYLIPVPEPETYAMLLAGLGFMGFIARRRKQQSSVV